LISSDSQVINHRPYQRVWCTFAVLLIFYCSTNLAQSPENLENKLKTAYLVNFAKFTSWKKAGDYKVICVFKSASIYPEIEQLEGGQNNPDNRVLVMVNPVDLGDCQLLYWDKATDENESRSILSTVHPGLLIVSDMTDVEDQKFAIQFFVRNLKLRFAINQDVIKNSEYRISSKLMRLSRQIE